MGLIGDLIFSIKSSFRTPLPEASSSQGRATRAAGSNADERNELKRKYRFEALHMHGGQWPAPGTHARAVPIYQTISYTFNSAEVVEGDDPEAFRAAIDAATKVLYIETLGNPSFLVPGFDHALSRSAVAAAA